MKYKLTHKNNWYIMEVRWEGYAGLVDWSITKPTPQQVRKFKAKCKKMNALCERNTVKRGLEGDL